MEDDQNVREYVQNDVGKVWLHSSRRNYYGKPWVYGQFEDWAIPACCFILDNSNLKPTERGNPTKVARAISAMVSF